MCRYSFEESEPWKTGHILPRNADENDFTSELSQKENMTVPIKRAKWEDIQKQKQFIPFSFRQFYDNLRPSSNANGNISNIGEDEENSLEEIEQAETGTTDTEMTTRDGQLIVETSTEIPMGKPRRAVTASKKQKGL